MASAARYHGREPERIARDGWYAPEMSGPVAEITTRDGALPTSGALGLLVVEPTKTRFVPLATRLVIGRAARCDVVLEDETVSRRQAFVFGTDPPVLEDAGSRHGTRFGADVLRAGERRALALGDVFVVGATYLSLQHAPPATPLPEVAEVPEVPGLVVRDSVMAKVLELVQMFAKSRLAVLIEGETGSGKELIAEAVHRLSERASGPLVKLNCAALPESLLEAELFGYERGAFTNAVQAKPGLVESADGGTLFLDEIADMSATVQAKMLRVLESGEVTRIGALRPKHVDVRLVSASHKALERLVEAGAFRADLYYRICGAKVRVPPLRERPDDILALAAHFLEAHASESGRGPTRFSKNAAQALRTHPWPGNVRELRTTVLRAALMARAGTTVEASHVELAPSPAPEATPLATHEAATPSAAEKVRIEAALEKTGGSQKRAAELLGISRRTLLRRLDELGIARPRKQS
jgi:DNA-binding NtrC family response regulator